jgi:putative ATP-dependent endonuclease of the OLD family
MRINKISIKNFRLLENVELLLEKKTTLIVGRNNSGKTSLTELFRRLLSDKASGFRLEDFSLSVHEQFWQAFILKNQGDEEKTVREALPIIEVKLTISYDENEYSLGLLSDFIIDLDPDCTETIVVIRNELEEGAIESLFEGLGFDPAAEEESQKTTFFRAIRERIKKSYTARVSAEDPHDPNNQKAMEWPQLRALLVSGFINAQRGLDDTTHRDMNLLGKILEALLKSAMSDAADPKDQEIAEKLKQAVDGMQEGIDVGFNKQLKDLFPAFSLFGYPGLSDPQLLTETTLDMGRLLKDHTKVHYAGINGIHLPEAYNGLGVRNLIFILLKVLEFFKAFKTMPTAPGIHLVFIEEPEVHLHPQMQEVFISKLSSIADLFATKFNDGIAWPVQFVVTTHSSHLANKAQFDSIRYFQATSGEGAKSACSTRIKDLREGLGGTPPDDLAFLHKYMTLTRCDLLFADKAVLIEGTTERLLLPRMIEKVDAETTDGPRLSSQYVSVVEVGGAYAHLFFDLLNFIDLRTLIITDLDTVNGNENRKSCKVSEGTHTSNACITNWFDDAAITPASLIAKSAEEKTNGIRRLAYQIPEKEGFCCGRSFEDAFILANPELFELKGGSEQERESDAWQRAEGVKRTKTEFALKYAIETTEWSTPRYIAEGLRWLRGPACDPNEIPLHATEPVVDASDSSQQEDLDA